MDPEEVAKLLAQEIPEGGVVVEFKGVPGITTGQPVTAGNQVKPGEVDQGGSAKRPKTIGWAITHTWAELSRDKIPCDLSKVDIVGVTRSPFAVTVRLRAA